jgi:hypothetical protein
MDDLHRRVIPHGRLKWSAESKKVLSDSLPFVSQVEPHPGFHPGEPSGLNTPCPVVSPFSSKEEE